MYRHNKVDTIFYLEYKMQLTHKIKLNPTVAQRIQLAKTAGCARYAYNWGLQKWNELYQAGERPNAYSLMRLWTQERPEWSKEVSGTAERHAIMDLGIAFTNFFQKRADRPVFKKKGERDGFYCANDAVFWFAGARLSIPRVGRVKATEALRFSGKVMGYHVVSEGNDWFICAHVETDHPLPGAYATEGTIVGIDVGLSHVATASDGSVLDLPAKLKQLEAKKRRQQRELDRSQLNTVTGRDGKQHKEYSKNGCKKLSKLRRTQQRINDIRKDATHKWTTAVCKSHATVVIETLDIEEMKQKAPKSLRRSLATSMMYEVQRQLKYKARHVVEAPRFFPSSKRCSQCGHRKEDLRLSDRTYTCAHCGLSIDRDLNASYNLMQTPWVTREAPVERPR